MGCMHTHDDIALMEVTNDRRCCFHGIRVVILKSGVWTIPILNCSAFGK